MSDDGTELPLSPPNAPAWSDDAPSLAEIEITPEMIEAGADIILGYDLEDLRAHQIAELVFKTMLSCRSREIAGTPLTPRTHRT